MTAARGSHGLMFAELHRLHYGTTWRIVPSRQTSTDVAPQRPATHQRPTRRATTMTENAVTAETSAKPRKPKGPELNWNADRDAALVAAIASGVTSTSALAAHLANDEAFVGVDASTITSGKIRLHIAKLRDAGVPIPEMGRGGKYAVDVTGLSALLGVAPGGDNEQASGE